MGLFALAAYRAGRLAEADRQYFRNTEASARNAVRLEPRNALYYVGLAELLERTGKDPRPALRQAVALKPDDADIRIRLGLRAEAAGDLEEAETQLLEAARRSRKYAPRWSLANFYFRRGQHAAFYKWAAEALTVSYGDRTPLFELCWQISPNADFLRDRLIPSRRPVRRDFATFLLAKHEFSAASALAAELASSPAAAETDYFLGLTDRFLAAGEFRFALAVWNSIAGAGLTPHAPLDPARGPVITNGRFRSLPLGRGFDWRIVDNPGAYVSHARPTGLRVSLSGRQPERCQLLWQFIPLAPGGVYRLSCRYGFAASLPMTPGSLTGLRWELHATGDGGPRLLTSGSLLCQERGSLNLVFRVPNQMTAGRLALLHERPLGSARAEGVLTVDAVQITPEDAPPSP